MTELQIKMEFAKILIANEYIESRLHLVNGHLKQAAKQQLNHTIKSVVMSNRLFENGFKHKEQAVNDCENDVELFTDLVELAINAENLERREEFLTDIAKLREKWN